MNRRSFATTTLGVLAAGSASAFAGPILTEKTPPQEADTHQQWLEDWQQAHNDFDLASCLPEGGVGDSVAENEAFERIESFAELIAFTKATTVAGVLSQVEFAIKDEASLCYPEELHRVLFENIKSSLRAMA